MAQLSPNRYKRLTSGPTYGQSDGLYWDATNSQLVLVMGDAIVARVDASGISADLEVTNEARGDILRRGASAWERHSAKTSGQLLIGDGTDIKSVAVTGDISITAAGLTAIGAGKVTNAMLGKPRLRCITEALTAASLTDGTAAVGTKSMTAAIPAGARFLFATIDSIVGFIGNVSATLTLGDGVDVDRYNTGTPSVFATAAAGVDMGAPSGTAFHSAAVANVIATVTSDSDITPVIAGGGSCNVNLWFLEPI